MSKFTPEILMVDIRKKEALKRPPLGEILQGIFFAIYNAKNNVDAAAALLEKHPTSAFGLYIGAMEEIGKVNKLVDAFIKWDSMDKLNEFYIRRKQHPWKLTSALGLIQKIVSLNSTKVTVSTKPQDKSIEKDFFSSLAKHFDPNGVHNLHQLRMAMTYTDFEEGISYSPHHFAERAKSDNLKIVIPIFSALLGVTISISEKIFPDLFALIKECYFCTEQEKIKKLKDEINRQATRVMPSLRKMCCEQAMKQSGICGDDWFEKYIDKIPEINFNGISIEAVMPEINNLISGTQEIELIYFYPPLKESAKDFYKSLEKEN